MRDLRFIAVIALIAATAAMAAAQDQSNPYEILNRYFEATGGLDRLQAEETFHAEGTLALGGMEGTLKIWTRKPDLSRVELALGPLNITQGDNGEHAWVLDQNGKLQVMTRPDEATVARRQVRKLTRTYAFADPESDVFNVHFAGIEQVDGKDCYVIRITNSINTDSYTSFIDAETFLQAKAVFIEDTESRDAFYGDYREVEGMRVPFWTKEVAHQTGQTQETKLARYESNPEVDAALFEPPEQGARDYTFLEGDRAENIPFRFVGNHLYIPVTAGGKERLWILDTGAGMSVLNRRFADELGLTLEGELTGQGAGGTVQVNLATLPSFRVASIQFDGQTVAVIDMDELIRRLGIDIAGILGFDFLSRFVTRVDYAGERVSFYDHETFEYTGDGETLDIHVRNSVFFMPATLDGEHSGSFLFDLGAGTTSLDGRYALREGYAGMKGVMRMAHGAGNEFQVKHVRRGSLEFSGLTIHDPRISFPYGGTDTAFSADQIGTLGNSLFRHFVLYIDYAHEHLIVEKGARFNESWPEDHSGLQIGWSLDREIEVLYVSPNTPAEEAGFQKGDLLRFISGIDANLLKDVIAVRELLEADPDTEYEIVVDRAGREMKLKIRMAELL